MNNIPIVYFPDGRPCPVLLTEQETITLLRLDTINIEHPADSLRRYRDANLLRGVQVSKKVFYYLPEIIRFIEAQVEAVKR
jgi:hypothetical protein